MHKHRSFAVVVPTLLWMLASLVSSQSLAARHGETGWISISDGHARYVMDSLATLDPEDASASGVAKFDDAVRDLGPGYLERGEALELGLIDELKERLEAAEHPRVRQDLQILITSLEGNVESRRLQAEHMLPYQNMHEWLFYSFRAILDPRIDHSRHAAALARLAKYVGSAEGYQPLLEQARERLAEALDTPGLIGPYREELRNDLENSPRFIEGIRDLLANSELSGWEEDFALLETQMREHTAWVEKEVLPRSRESNLLPPAIYADLLKNYGVRSGPETLILDASAAFQSIRVEMQALAVKIAGERGWENGNLQAVMRRLKKEQIAPEEVLPTFRDRLAALEDIIREQDIVTLPERDANIRLASEAESAAVPASFMSPPQLIDNSGQYGEFVLVQRNPALGPEAQMDDWTHDAIIWALTAHEARPGHELQFARLVEDGVSIARAQFAFNSANAEGWGLYAEALVHPYLPLEAQLFSLFSRWMRAARMFLDPMINTGQLTRDEAATFLEEEMVLSPAMAASEADRYTYRMPGQATSYYYGFRKLMALRTLVELRQGEAFHQRRFHDFVLEQGLLPPEMLRDAVIEEFLGDHQQQTETGR